jgi:glutaminyl-peptide cyclotransferase
MAGRTIQTVSRKHPCVSWLGLLLGGAVLTLGGCSPAAPQAFSGDAAYSLAREFLEFGPRVSGTEANRRAGDWIEDQLKEAGWKTFEDEGSYMDTAVRNIAGRKGSGPVVILGAHYDSRRCADQMPGDCVEPVLGANDGASGVAVLLELARVLEPDWRSRQIWLVFFDAEDNGQLDGWDWIVGSRQFALSVKAARESGEEFQAMVLLDMIGDSDLQIYFEGNSDPELREEIWSVAGSLGYKESFIPMRKFTMIDDHIPFRDLGIPSVDIIDFEYPYWHTGADTLDKISAESLEKVGRTMEVWVEGGTQDGS